MMPSVHETDLQIREYLHHTMAKGGFDPKEVTKTDEGFVCDLHASWSANQKKKAVWRAELAEVVVKTIFPTAHARAARYIKCVKDGRKVYRYMVQVVLPH